MDECASSTEQERSSGVLELTASWRSKTRNSFPQTSAKQCMDLATSTAEMFSATLKSALSPRASPERCRWYASNQLAGLWLGITRTDSPALALSPALAIPSRSALALQHGNQEEIELQAECERQPSPQW